MNIDNLLEENERRLGEVLHSMTCVYEGLCYRLPEEERKSMLTLPSYLAASALFERGFDNFPMTSTVATGFADWIDEEDCRKTVAGWIMRATHYGKYYTTKELYEIYLKQKQ